MSYHSYRNIGFIFTDTEANCVQWRNRFSGFDPGTAAAALGLACDGTYVRISYFGNTYRLSLADGVLTKYVPSGEADDGMGLAAGSCVPGPK